MSTPLDMFRISTEINVSQLALLSRQSALTPEEVDIVRYARAASQTLAELSRRRDEAVKKGAHDAPPPSR